MFYMSECFLLQFLSICLFLSLNQMAITLLFSVKSLIPPPSIFFNLFLASCDSRLCHSLSLSQSLTNRIPLCHPGSYLLGQSDPFILTRKCFKCNSVQIFIKIVLWYFLWGKLLCYYCSNLLFFSLQAASCCSDGYKTVQMYQL